MTSVKLQTLALTEEVVVSYGWNGIEVVNEAGETIQRKTWEEVTSVTDCDDLWRPDATLEVGPEDRTEERFWREVAEEVATAYAKKYWPNSTVQFD